jgi:hypothetical protein
MGEAYFSTCSTAQSCLAKLTICRQIRYMNRAWNLIFSVQDWVHASPAEALGLSLWSMFLFSSRSGLGKSCASSSTRRFEEESNLHVKDQI